MNFATVDGLGRFVDFYVAVRRQCGRAAAVGAVMLGLVGCATGPVGSGSGAVSADAKVALVTKRAQDRWNALLEGNVKAAYAYLSPASRQVVSVERYEQKTNPANFRAVKFRDVACQEQTCQVDLWLTFDHRMMKGVQTPISETWVFENGQAWYVYRE